MKNNKKAFTLTELLLALGIVGALAALAIPSLLNSINSRIMVSQVKNIVSSVQQLAGDQIVTKRSKDLNNTDFASAASLMTISNFDVVRFCENPGVDCWKTAVAGSGDDDDDDDDDAETPEVSYRNINMGAFTVGAASADTTAVTVILKNGATVAYERDTSKSYNGTSSVGKFSVDVNGPDAPNIAGRDYFEFYVTKNGVISPMKAAVLADCKSGDAVACFAVLLENGWNLP